MNKKIEKEHDTRQRFSLRKLSVGLASVLVGVSFMTISAGQTVHADELQKPSQSDLATKKADNVTNDSANDNEQNQAKSDTAQTINHVDANSNRQQNADKNEAEASATTATNAIVDRQANVAATSNKNAWGGDIAKDDANNVQETVNPPQKAMANQKEQATVAFSVKKVNQTITPNMLNENKVADAQGSSSSTNNGVDPVKFASNGGFDPEIWGTMNISEWQLDASGNITGYNGNESHIIIPNSADFAKAGKNYRQISISSDEMKKLIIKHHDYDGDGEILYPDDGIETLAISLTADKKVKATNADWHEAFANSILNQANLDGLDTSNITNMSGMFTDHQGLSYLTSLDVSKWNTNNVTNMSHMFNDAINLTNLDVSKWDTSKVTDMSYMFSDARSLTSLDVSNWDTNNVTNMSNMFYGASSLKSLDVSKWNTNNVTNMSNMFYGASSLKSLDVSNWDTGKVTDMHWMFAGASSLKSLDVSKWNTGKVTDMHWMFAGASSLKSLDVSKWDTSKVTDMRWMFGATQNLTSLDVSKWDTSNVTNMSNMFYGASSLKSLDVSKWDTSKVTDMRWMFDGASSLKSLDVSKWNTSNVTDMSWMFYNANSLTNLDVSNWDTNNVTNMSNMFYGASSLKSLDVSNWDTGKVTDMHWMFYGASSLKSLDVSKWNTSNVTNMSNMFYGASSLKSLDVSKWNTSKVTDMRWMFDGANKLTLIANNPSGWQHATDNSAFDGVPVVITNNANILNVTDNGNYTIDDYATTRSVIFNSANSELKLPAYKGYANYTSDADRLKYASDVIKVYNDKLMQDYSATHTDKMLKYANNQDMNDPVALARTKFVTAPKVEDIIDNPANYAKLHATATREYIIHNIDGSTTTITQSINYRRTGKHNLVTNDDIFTEWIYSPDENSVIVVATKDKTGKAIASPVTVEGNNCIEKDGKAYFSSIKIKPKAGFKLAVDKPATAKLNLQAKLASRLLPRQFFVLKVFAPMPHKVTKQVASANSIKPKQDHNNASAKPITSANAIKQGKDVIVKPIVKLIEPNKQTAIHDQTHAGSPIDGLANSEAQLADVQNISMAKPDVNDQRSMQVANLSTENSQKSVEAKSQHPAVSINGKVKSAEIAAKSADSRQNQNKKVLAEKASAKPIANISMANISTKAKKVSVKPAVNIPAKTAQPATQKTTAITNKQTIANHSLPQTSSVNDSDALVAIGLIMVSLDVALAGTRKHE